MKNKHQEALKRKAKAYNTSHVQLDPEYGIRIYHCYEDDNGVPYKDKGYWDDVSFFHHGKYVCVWWTHPRYQYSEHCDTMAYEDATKLFDDRRTLKNLVYTNPKYKKVGRSRKKLISKTIEFPDSDEKFYQHWRTRRAELCKTTDFVQKCHIKVKQYNYCIGVDLCIPIEVVDRKSLHELSMIARSLLDNPLKFKELYGNYAYTKDDFNQENPEIA